MKMNKILYITLVLSMSFLTTIALGFEQPIQFETPRTMALGGAFTGLSNDASAIFSNPAGNASENRKSISMDFGFNYHTYKWDQPQLAPWSEWNNYTGYLLYWENQGVFSVTHKRSGNKAAEVAMPESEKTAEPLFNETTISISAAEKMSEDIYMGVMGTYVYTKSDYWDAYLPNSHIGIFDVGIMYIATPQIKFGFSTRNLLTTQSNYLLFDDFGNVQRIERLPQDFNLGVSFKVGNYVNLLIDSKNILEGEIEYPADWNAPEMSLKRSYHAGIEMWFSPYMVLRGGVCQKEVIADFTELDDNGDFIYNHRTNFSTGFGIKKDDMLFNFATTFDKLNNKITENSFIYNASVMFVF
jgi:hypothetical protein